MRILLVSQMYPGPADPDLGVFVCSLEEALVERGHVVERAVLDRRAGGKRKYLTLSAATLQAARRFRPDVVYAHFLVPTGLIAALAGRAPLVVTAHGRDVRNVGWLPGIGAATRLVVRRAATVIAVSDYLRRELETKVPDARNKTVVIDSGVDLKRFAVTPAPADGPRYLCIASLIQRKNVLRLADAFARVGRHELRRPADARRDHGASAGHRLEQRLAERLDEARLADDVRRGDQLRNSVVRDAAGKLDALAPLELRA